jgi:hypothetical protein
MTRRLRARLDRLAPAADAVLGQDRDRDRRRRDELSRRELSRAALTEMEQAELSGLHALFHDEDRDRDRLLNLTLRRISAETLGEEPLTDDETRELAELERRYPPDPNHFLKDVIEAWKRPRATG